MRRDGHSTATVIEQLRSRLRDAPGLSGWVGDVESENAALLGGRDPNLSGGREGQGASKKRRMGDAAADVHCTSSVFDLSSDGRSEEGSYEHFAFFSERGAPTGRAGFVEPLPSAYLADLSGEAGGGSGGKAHPYSSHEKRHRDLEGGAAPLAQLKKLKLRAQAEAER